MFQTLHGPQVLLSLEPCFKRQQRHFSICHMAQLVYPQHARGRQSDMTILTHLLCLGDPSQQTYRVMPTTSLFSRRSSKSLHDAAEAAAQADAHRHKMVHNLAWAFDHGGRSYIMVYELSQW